jgi:hypothetical protein
MTTQNTGDTKQLLEQLVALTDAVKQLAERPTSQPAPAALFEPTTAADRIRQRVAFGYQVLGTLTGRVSSAGGDEFDIRAVRATRRPGVILFRGLPPGADFAELRQGNKVEVLRILDEGGDRGDQPEAPDDRRDGRADRGLVRPRDFADGEPIGSIVFLRHRRGPFIAFGPRLGPVRPGGIDPDRADHRA